MADRFDKFTERARKVFALAEDEARRFNHNYIGTEHLLLGILSEGEGVAAKVLVDLGTSLAKARSQVEFIIGRGDRTVRGDIGLTPRAKKVIELSVDEARRLNHHYIGTEHLLLGLVREGEGIAAGMLESLGISLSTVRVQVIHVLNQSSTYPTQQSRPEVDPPGRAEEWDRSRTPFGRLTVRARQVLLLASDTARKHGETVASSSARGCPSCWRPTRPGSMANLRLGFSTCWLDWCAKGGVSQGGCSRSSGSRRRGLRERWRHSAVKESLPKRRAVT